MLKKIIEESETEGGKVALLESEKPFALCCLGRFSLLRSGVPVALEGKKARELVAFLACEEGRPTAKRMAAEALWPGREEQRAMDSLYKVCRQLQEPARRGEIPAVHSTRGSLWLDMEQVECDLTAFRALTGPTAEPADLRRAVELYRGPLLAEEGCEWAGRLEGFYDMRYLEAVEALRDYFHRLGREREAEYYEGLME